MQLVSIVSFVLDSNHWVLIAILSPLEPYPLTHSFFTPHANCLVDTFCCQKNTNPGNFMARTIEMWDNERSSLKKDGGAFGLPVVTTLTKCFHFHTDVTHRQRHPLHITGCIPGDSSYCRHKPRGPWWHWPRGQSGELLLQPEHFLYLVHCVIEWRLNSKASNGETSEIKLSIIGRHPSNEWRFHFVHPFTPINGNWPIRVLRYITTLHYFVTLLLQ